MATKFRWTRKLEKELQGMGRDFAMDNPERLDDLAGAATDMAEGQLEPHGKIPRKFRGAAAEEIYQGMLAPVKKRAPREKKADISKFP